jgi:hypothetical protein
MKRLGQLIEKIADINNLHVAFYKAQKGKITCPDVYAYRVRLQENLLILQQQIRTGVVETGNYHFFIVYDPKKRLICATSFSQRVLHHALMNVCHTSFEKHQISCSFASRRGKGTYSALDSARAFHSQYQWFLKLDVRKYFESIDHLILKHQLRKLFKDQKLLFIFDNIIDSYSTQGHKSLPIGNLTSQYFANHYLSIADHYLKEVLRMPGYVRYMDDMIMWHHDKEQLLETGFAFKEFIERELKLGLKPFCLNKNIKGLPFLGYILFPDEVRLSQRSKKRFIRRSECYESKRQKSLWSQQEYASHVLPLVAFTEYANAKEFRKNVYSKLFPCEE